MLLLVKVLNWLPKVLRKTPTASLGLQASTTWIGLVLLTPVAHIAVLQPCVRSSCFTKNLRTKGPLHMLLPLPWLPYTFAWLIFFILQFKCFHIMNIFLQISEITLPLFSPPPPPPPQEFTSCKITYFLFASFFIFLSEPKESANRNTHSVLFSIFEAWCFWDKQQ